MTRYPATFEVSCGRKMSETKIEKSFCVFGRVLLFYNTIYLTIQKKNSFVVYFCKNTSGFFVKFCENLNFKETRVFTKRTRVMHDHFRIP